MRRLLEGGRGLREGMDGGAGWEIVLLLWVMSSRGSVVCGLYIGVTSCSPWVTVGVRTLVVRRWGLPKGDGHVHVRRAGEGYPSGAVSLCWGLGPTEGPLGQVRATTLPLLRIPDRSMRRGMKSMTVTYVGVTHMHGARTSVVVH